MTLNDIQTLINKDETRELELKKTTGELKDGMRSACAFLNTAGGWLVFGIAPATLQIIGQQVTDNTRREIAMQEQCNDVCMTAPSFIAERGCFRVVFLRPDYGQQGSMKGGMKGGMKGDRKRGMNGGTTRGTTGGTTREKHQIGLSDYDLMLLDIMEGNPHITITEMTNRIGLTRRNTYEHIKKLQAKGCVLREGPDRGGVWRVLKR